MAAVLTIPRALGLLAAATMAGYGIGYAHRAHLCTVAEVKQEATAITAKTTTTAATKATDKAAIQRLEAQLASAKDRADALQALINEDRDATPAPAHPDLCRLPDRLRDALNADLAGRP